ncbi:DNA replication protein DnaC [Lactobacillus helveticus]|uniref:DnaA ATPase domain-containing protein n=1 Tax=Lactobacillus helveticus TaxID=1587 RepID=UPI001562B723|nr:DnaA/Hda family protein [Lactobacillus helveticus]NRO47724.1 DNA replication protein DnaC [Lactobacillus helveticus]
MQGLSGIKVPTKKEKAVCPIHHIHLVSVGKVKPFCTKCVAEDIEKEKRKMIDDFKVDNVKGVLKRDSLVDMKSEYDCTFDTFKAQQGTKEAELKHRTKMIAYEAIERPDKPIHAIFYGTPGEGKTHLAMSILNAVNENANPPQKCLFIDINELINRIYSSFKNTNQLWNKDYAIKKLRSVDLLVLDDIGSESSMKSDTSEASNFIQEILKKVLDGQKRLIITTNLTSRQLSQVYNPKIVSRMFAHSRGYAIDFSGVKDKRY